MGRAGVQATVLELESVHATDRATSRPEDDEARPRHHTQEDMELAVLLQEIASFREERADLRSF